MRNRSGPPQEIVMSGPDVAIAGNELAKTKKDLGEAKRQLETIVDTQKRTRPNRKELPTARANKRLVNKIDEQEPQVKKVLSRQTAQQKDIDNFLTAFSAE
jgi:hypothetical protein